MSDKPASLIRPAEKLFGLTHGELDHLRPFFIGAKAGPQRNRYVLWVDIMGSQGKMLRGIRAASIPLMKLHVAALDAQKKNNRSKNIDLYPVIDGIYVVCEDMEPLVFAISHIFRAMAAEFIVLDHWERSVIRGAIAYGPVILGKESVEGAEILKENDGYASSILLGMPLVQAYVTERATPPFGVFIHESVRAFGTTGDKPVTAILWKWWQTNEEAYKLARALLPSLNEYYEWCSIHPISSDYAPERLSAHRAMAYEYFSEFRSELKTEMSLSGPSEEAIATLRARKQRRRRLNAPPPVVKKPRATNPVDQAEHLREKLGLTETEYLPIKALFIERYSKLAEARSNKSLTGQQVQSQCKSILKDSDEQLTPLLTEEQRTILGSGRS